MEGVVDVRTVRSTISIGKELRRDDCVTRSAYAEVGSGEECVVCVNASLVYPQEILVGSYAVD